MTLFRIDKSSMRRRVGATTLLQFLAWFYVEALAEQRLQNQKGFGHERMVWQDLVGSGVGRRMCD